VDRQERFGSASRVIQVGFWVNAGLMTMKLLAGHFGRSEAVFADGMESAADFIAILASMIALRIGSQPYDEAHPYGHGKAESLAAIIVALVIFGTGGWILFRPCTPSSTVPMRSGRRGRGRGIPDDHHQRGPVRYSITVGKRLGSPAILAAAKDHRKDAITSVSTLSA